MILYALLYMFTAVGTFVLRADDIGMALPVASAFGVGAVLIVWGIDKMRTRDNASVRFRWDVLATAFAISLITWAATPLFVKTTKDSSDEDAYGLFLGKSVDTTFDAPSSPTQQPPPSTRIFDEEGNLTRYYYNNYLVSEKEQDHFDKSLASLELMTSELGEVIRTINTVDEFLHALSADVTAQRSAKRQISVLKMKIREFLKARPSALDEVTQEALENSNDVIMRDMIVDNDSSLRVFYDTLEVALGMQLDKLNTNLMTLASMAAKPENWKDVGSRTELISNDLQWKWNDAFKGCRYALRALEDGYMLYGGHCVLLLRHSLPQVSLTD